MFKIIVSLCNYIFERITDRDNIVDEKLLLEEDTHYRIMVDGDFYLKPNTKINEMNKENESTNKENRIKDRMDIYKK